MRSVQRNLHGRRCGESRRGGEGSPGMHMCTPASCGLLGRCSGGAGCSGTCTWAEVRSRCGGEGRPGMHMCTPALCGLLGRSSRGAGCSGTYSGGGAEGRDVQVCICAHLLATLLALRRPGQLRPPTPPRRSHTRLAKPPPPPGHRPTAPPPPPRHRPSRSRPIATAARRVHGPSPTPHIQTPHATTRLHIVFIDVQCIRMVYVHTDAPGHRNGCSHGARHGARLRSSVRSDACEHMCMQSTCALVNTHMCMQSTNTHAVGVHMPMYTCRCTHADVHIPLYACRWTESTAVCDIRSWCVS